MAKKFETQNSTAESRIFQIKWKKDDVQIVYQDESVWCMHKSLTQLFDAVIPAISKHPDNILQKENSYRFQLFPK